MITKLTGYRSVYYAPIDKIGGGNSSPRMVKPNIAFIEKLRRSPLDPSRPRKIKSIALLDDNRDVVESIACLFEVVLSKSGINVKTINAGTFRAPRLPEDQFTVLTANSPDEIMRMPGLIHELNIGLTIADFNMSPGLNGGQVIKQARELGALGIMIGYTGMNNNIQSFYDAGADLAVLKPFDPDNLLEVK